LQQAIFPIKLQFGDGAYRTAESRMVFFKLEGKQVKKKGLVALTITSWNRIIDWLLSIESLRKTKAFTLPSLGTTHYR
jgi:hypothetical protein